MRFDLRLHGVTGDGKKCQADITIYAVGEKEMFNEVQKASERGPWRYAEGPEEWVAEGSAITVENLENLAKATPKKTGKMEPRPEHENR
ncbi:MAG: hypothetical protein U0793_21385 [Gemmataceae bacterium]